MSECETCGSTDMSETTWITEDYNKVPIMRCNICGYCNDPIIKTKKKFKSLKLYQEIHKYVRENKLQPDECELCGNEFDNNGSSLLELSNKTGKLIKDIDNFQWVHLSCHHKYDKDNKIKHEKR